MSNTDDPSLTIQTASLWSEGANDIFSGSGGPWGYDPWFGEFAGTVSSSGLDSEPFADQLWNVAAGDQIVFVIAVQNRGDTRRLRRAPARHHAGRLRRPGRRAPKSASPTAPATRWTLAATCSTPSSGLLIQDPIWRPTTRIPARTSR